jgi:hypothetical protein
MGQKAERHLVYTGTQVVRRATDGESVEPARFSFHRLAPVALAALGIFGALLTIFAGLVALNHTVLPFKGWPLDGERLNTGTQVLPRAPVESGRLRTAPGGVLAGASPLVRGVLPALVVTAPPHTTSGIGLRVQRGRSNASLPKHGATSAPQQVAATPQPAAPSPAPAAPAPTPAPVPAPVVVSAAPISRAPSTSTATSTSSAPGNGHGNGRAHAPGQLKKVAAPAAPAAPAAAPPAPAAPATAADDDGGHGNGHGPPPWAHGHH